MWTFPFMRPAFAFRQIINTQQLISDKNKHDRIGACPDFCIADNDMSDISQTLAVRWQGCAFVATACQVS